MWGFSLSGFLNHCSCFRCVSKYQDFWKCTSCILHSYEIQLDFHCSSGDTDLLLDLVWSCLRKMHQVVFLDLVTNMWGSVLLPGWLLTGQDIITLCLAKNKENAKSWLCETIQHLNSWCLRTWGCICNRCLPGNQRPSVRNSWFKSWPGSWCGFLWLWTSWKWEMPVVRSVHVSRGRWIWGSCSFVWEWSSINWPYSGFIWTELASEMNRWLGCKVCENFPLLLTCTELMSWVYWTHCITQPWRDYKAEVDWKSLTYATSEEHLAWRCLHPWWLLVMPGAVYCRDEQTNLMCAQTWKSELINQWNNLWMWSIPHKLLFIRLVRASSLMFSLP